MGHTLWYEITVEITLLTKLSLTSRDAQVVSNPVTRISTSLDAHCFSGRTNLLSFWKLRFINDLAEYLMELWSRLHQIIW
jgi:hypothetical protein|tara:strand:- start:388 stop:627 length:240 start_codon:yes stop_codon:yes gene_type:complete